MSVRRAARRVASAPIRAYRVVVSPLMSPRCRFVPSCSAYAVEAIESRGVAVGLWLALRRVARCHPFHPGGYDPVPLDHESARHDSRADDSPEWAIQCQS